MNIDFFLSEHFHIFGILNTIIVDQPIQVMSQDNDLPPSLLEDLYGVQVHPCLVNVKLFSALCHRIVTFFACPHEMFLLQENIRERNPAPQTGKPVLVLRPGGAANSTDDGGQEGSKTRWRCNSR